MSSPVVGDDGTVYVGGRHGNLFAIESSSGGLADSSWPMFRHDVRHTGRFSIRGPDDILAFFDRAVELKTLKVHDEAVRANIKLGTCFSLYRAYLWTDGKDSDDKVTGPAAPDLNAMILSLLKAKNCPQLKRGRP